MCMCERLKNHPPKKKKKKLVEDATSVELRSAAIAAVINRYRLVTGHRLTTQDA